MHKKIDPNSQLGQTLIETLVAIFVLTTALITAAGLAFYSFRSSDNSSRQIVATALAREAIEGVKNIRDSNWQSDTLSTTCHLPDGSSQNCYPNWIGNGYTSLAQGNYSVDFDQNNNTWKMHAQGSNPNYLLNFDTSSGTYSSQNPTSNPSDFYRRVNLTYYTAYPYDAWPRIDVTVTVWWGSRNCPAADGSDASLAALPASCKVVLVDRLTNWKNY